MKLDFTFDGSIDPVALYAAVLSTIIALWELRKWNSRHSVQVKCNPNMIFIPSSNKNKYIVTNVINKGEFPTTITHLLMYFWESRYDQIFRKKKRQSFIVNTDQVPIVVNPGEQWMGQALQDEGLERMASNGYLYCGIIHSMGKKEILQRVKINPEKITTKQLTPALGN